MELLYVAMATPVSFRKLSSSSVETVCAPKIDLYNFEYLGLELGSRAVGVTSKGSDGAGSNEIDARGVDTVGVRTVEAAEINSVGMIAGAVDTDGVVDEVGLGEGSIISSVVDGASSVAGEILRMIAVTAGFTRCPPVSLPFDDKNQYLLSLRLLVVSLFWSRTCCFTLNRLAFCSFLFAAITLIGSLKPLWLHPISSY